ncbi:MAG: type II secretion system protein [Candidatus Paceibacterota bacterium]
MKPIFNFQFLVISLRKIAQRFSAGATKSRSLKTKNYTPDTYFPVASVLSPYNRGHKRDASKDFYSTNFAFSQQNHRKVGVGVNLKPTFGFSLIELLVSMALFIVVLTIGVGALMVLISSNAKAQNIQVAVSNIQFALDSMAREVRTGNGYYCSTGAETTGDYKTVQDCNKGTYLSVVEGGKSLTQGAQNRRIAYRYNASGQSVERKIGNGVWVPLTSSGVKVTSMHFNVANSAGKQSNGNALQPNVTIYIRGNITGVGDTSTEFTLQTTVTQRTLDL